MSQINKKWQTGQKLLMPDTWIVRLEPKSNYFIKLFLMHIIKWSETFDIRFEHNIFSKIHILCASKQQNHISKMVVQSKFSLSHYKTIQFLHNWPNYFEHRYTHMLTKVYKSVENVLTAFKPISKSNETSAKLMNWIIEFFSFAFIIFRACVFIIEVNRQRNLANTWIREITKLNGIIWRKTVFTWK